MHLTGEFRRLRLKESEEVHKTDGSKRSHANTRADIFEVTIVQTIVDP